MKFRRTLIATLLTAYAGQAYAQQEQRKNFASCPVVQDTKTVPCWLAEYGGELYYLGIQTDISAEFHPPYLGHKVLVEGVISNEPRICGGVVLKPVVVSPLIEPDPSCNTILPAVDKYNPGLSDAAGTGGRSATTAPYGEGILDLLRLRRPGDGKARDDSLADRGLRGKGRSETRGRQRLSRRDFALR
jgi:hypothetical protein